MYRTAPRSQGRRGLWSGSFYCSLLAPPSLLPHLHEYHSLLHRVDTRLVVSTFPEAKGGKLALGGCAPVYRRAYTRVQRQSRKDPLWWASDFVSNISQ